MIHKNRFVVAANHISSCSSLIFFSKGHLGSNELMVQAFIFWVVTTLLCQYRCRILMLMLIVPGFGGFCKESVYHPDKIVLQWGRRDCAVARVQGKYCGARSCLADHRSSQTRPLSCMMTEVIMLVVTQICATLLTIGWLYSCDPIAIHQAGAGRADPLHKMVMMTVRMRMPILRSWMVSWISLD